jgi:hypothetical protein
VTDLERAVFDAAVDLVTHSTAYARAEMPGEREMARAQEMEAASRLNRAVRAYWKGK